MGRLRICQESGCSGPAPFDYEGDGKWYCGVHIAIIVFNGISMANRLTDYGVCHVTAKKVEGIDA